MKKLLLSFAFIAGMMVSCTTDTPEVNKEGEESVLYRVNIDVPELATRSGETDMNSGLGAIDNFSDDEWANYDVRYILEVYDVTDGYANLNEPIKARDIQTLDEYEPTNFEIHLIPERDYRFVVWADFVAEGSQDDLHYDTSDLNAITRKSVNAMDECMDAYFIQKDVHVNVGGLEESLTLKRPFGKIRVITNDYNEVNIGSEPKKVEVKFYNHKLFTTLNAVTGVASGETHNEYTYTIAKDAPYTKGYDELDENMTLFADYILAGDEATGAQEVNFTIKVWDENGREIRNHDFNTQIPLQRNHLTTIVGNMLTTQNDISINIDDDFDGEYIRNWGSSAITIENGNWGLGEINANGNYEFVINDGANDFTLIVPQSAVNQKTGKLTPVGKAEFVASEAELEKNTFTITGLKVDPTRAAQDVTVTHGTMRVSNWNDGVHVQFELYYSLDPESDRVEYNYIRIEFKGDAIGMYPLATPVVAAAAVENVITLSWAAIEGAGSYAITNGTEMPVFVDVCEYTFTGDYASEYTFAVVAVPADEAKNYPSEAAEVTITIGAELLATPVVTAEVNENIITLSWEAITGADKYGITAGTEMPVFTEATTYEFKGDYNTEYTFNVVALADNEERYKPSNPAEVTAKTEVQSIVTEFNKMEYKNYNGSYYFFTFDLTNDNGDTATLNVSDYLATEAGVKNASEWYSWLPNPAIYYESAGDAGNGFHINNIKIGGVEYGKPTAVEGTGLTCEDGVITITAVLGDVVATMTIDQNNLVKPKQPRTVTVKVDAAMPEMYFYSWTDAGTITAGWPGDLMTNNGNGEFSYTYTEEWDGQTVNFIFNNGLGSQTEDITGVVLDGDKYYERYDIVVPPVIEPGNDVYSVIGDFTVGNWNIDIELVEGADGIRVAKDVEFANANNEGFLFKVRKNYNWSDSYGVDTTETFGLNEKIDLNGGTNISVNAELNKKYDIYFDLTNMQVWVVEQAEGPVTFDPWTFSGSLGAGNFFSGYTVTLTGDNGDVIVLNGGIKIDNSQWYKPTSATLNGQEVEVSGNGARINSNTYQVDLDITLGNRTYRGTSSNKVA